VYNRCQVHKISNLLEVISVEKIGIYYFPTISYDVSMLSLCDCFKANWSSQWGRSRQIDCPCRIYARNPLRQAKILFLLEDQGIWAFPSQRCVNMFLLCPTGIFCSPWRLLAATSLVCAPAWVYLLLDDDLMYGELNPMRVRSFGMWDIVVQIWKPNTTTQEYSHLFLIL